MGLYNTSPRQQSYLTPEEEDNLLASLGRSTLGGLAYVGSTLDKPGRAVRGILSGLTGGEWGGGLLNLIPFSDTMGITDSEGVTGRELLEGWGALGPNESGLDAGDVAGFAADVLLDPTTYLTLGGSALTQSGKAAKMAGELAPAVRGAGDALTMGAREAGMRAGQRGLVGVGLPFMDPLVTLGSRAVPAAADDVTRTLPESIARGMDFAGEALRYGSLGDVPVVGDMLPEVLQNFSPGRQAAALFNKGVKGTYSKPAQIAAQAMSDAERLVGEDATLDAIGHYDKLKQAGLGSEQYFDPLTMSVEGLTPHQGIEGAELISDVGRTMQASQDAAYAKLQGTGINAPELELDSVPGMVHAARYINPSMAGDASKGRIFQNQVDSLLHRDDYLKDVPAHYVNLMNRGELTAEQVAPLIGRGADDIARFTATQAELKALLDDAVTNGNWHPLDLRYRTPDVPHGLPTDKLQSLAAQELTELARKIKQPGELAKRFGREAAEEGDELYDLGEDAVQPIGQNFYMDPIQAHARYMRQVAQATKAAEGTLDLLAKYSTEGAGVPLSEVLKKTRFSNKGGKITDTAIANFLQRKGVQVPEGVDPADLLAQYHVPQEIADDVTRHIAGFSNPESVGPVLALYDWATQAFKTSVTTPWPSFHTRNMVTGMWQNAVGGAADIEGYSLARELLRGGAPEAAMRHPLAIKAGKASNPQEAADFLRGQLYARNVAGQTFTNEITGRFVPPSENFAGNILGEPGAEISLLGKGNPLSAGIEGFQNADTGGIVGKLKGAVGGAVKAGHQGGNYVEGLNRAAGFLSLTRQGYDASTAAAKIRALQVDFGNLSEFERKVMRRAVPFYSFTKGMIPEVLRELIERPGGLTGQAAQLSATIREGQDAFLPEYLQGGLGIPLGPEGEDGTQKFLTNLDLPVESVFEPLHAGPGWMAQTGQDLLSQLNPFIKGPLELATGQQFFTGRKLADLYSPTGSVVADQLIGNSPLTRAASSLRTAFDDRKSIPIKAINLLTGARVSDVDIDKQRSIASRELLEESLRGPGQTFEHLYIPESVLPTLSPEELKQYQLYKALSSRAQKEAREKKKRIGVRQ